MKKLILILLFAPLFSAAQSLSATAGATSSGSLIIGAQVKYAKVGLYINRMYYPTTAEIKPEIEVSGVPRTTNFDGVMTGIMYHFPKRYDFTIATGVGRIKQYNIYGGDEMFITNATAFDFFVGANLIERKYFVLSANCGLNTKAGTIALVNFGVKLSK
jgi:hypothetical protein